MKQKTPKPEKIHFSDEAIESFLNLGVILNKIHIRLIAEGYTITDDDIILPKNRIAEVLKGKKKVKKNFDTLYNK